MKVLCWVGSLRSGSFGGRLAGAVAQAADGMTFETVDGRDLPHYDQDLDGDDKPAPVVRLLEQVTACDAMVFVTPEFNYGIPGPLKNAIDWASRPAYRSPLKGKPSLVIAYSIAPTGGLRAHQHLCDVLAGTLTPVHLGPTFIVPAVHEKLDDDGTLTDELTKVRLERTLGEFGAWARTLAG